MIPAPEPEVEDNEVTEDHADGTDDAEPKESGAVGEAADDGDGAEEPAKKPKHSHTPSDLEVALAVMGLYSVMMWQ